MLILILKLRYFKGCKSISNLTNLFTEIVIIPFRIEE